MTTADCVFCSILAGHDPTAKYTDHGHAVIFGPLNPVTPGHMLVVPKKHVTDAGDDSLVAAMAMSVAAEYAQRHYASYNLITSKGEPATQTVNHLHIHIVPRRFGDGLALPWTDQQSSSDNESADDGGS